VLTPPPPPDAVPDQDDAIENKAPAAEKDEEEKNDVPPAGLIPFDPSILPKAIAPIEGVRPISSISPIPGSKPGAVSTAAAQRLLQEMREPGFPAQTVGGTSWLEDLMKGLGGPGPAQAQAAGPQPVPPDSGGDYSGRESAPLTSFSLVNWLLGL
jgi:hypothetical protein